MSEIYKQKNTNTRTASDTLTEDKIRGSLLKRRGLKKVKDDNNDESSLSSLSSSMFN